MMGDAADSSSHNNGDNTPNNMLSRNQYMETRLSKFLMTPVISLRTRTVLRDGSGLTVAKPLSRLFDKIQIGNLKKEGKINKARRPTHKKLPSPKTASKQQHEKDNIISQSTTNNESGVNFMPHIEEIQRQSSTPSSTGSTQFLSKEDVQLLEKVTLYETPEVEEVISEGCSLMEGAEDYANNVILVPHNAGLEVRQPTPKRMRRTNTGESDNGINETLGIIMSVSENIRGPATQLQKPTCDAFGEYVASKVREYSAKVQNTVQFKMNEILYQADMGTFD